MAFILYLYLYQIGGILRVEGYEFPDEIAPFFRSVARKRKKLS